MTKIRFETESCTRCGGSGRYSFNLRDGDRCWGCNGTGDALSRKGAAARKAYDDAMTEACETPAWTVRPGDKVQFLQFSGRKVWREVESVRTRWTEIAPCTWSDGRVSPGAARFDTTRRASQRRRWGGHAGMMVRRHPGAERVRGIMADIAARFAGATIVEEVAA